MQRNLLDIIQDLEEEYEHNEEETVKESDVPRSDPSEKLQEERVSLETVPKTQSAIEPQSVKSKLKDKKECHVNLETNARPKYSERSVELLADIQTSSSPLRPTELLCRILSRNREMKPKIFIPRMTLVKDSDSSQCSNGDSVSSSPRKKRLPHFNYYHGDGHRRNLPGEPELIRLLTDPEMQLSGDSKGAQDGEPNTKNTWLSLYGGTIGPPLVNRNQQRRTKRRRILCKYCRRSPGDHQKWCVHYTDPKDFDNLKLKMVRSFTDDDIDPNSNMDKTRPLEKSKTTLDETSLKPDMPDYSTLHRDVYVRALADRQTRLLMKQTHDFLRQTTKPFVFSYFDSQRGNRIARERIDEMEHIFGENQTDFTEYYKFLSSSDS